MLDQLAGVVSESFSTTKNISTLFIGRVPLKFLGAAFLISAAFLAQNSFAATQAKTNLAEGVFANFPQIYTSSGPILTKITKAREQPSLGTEVRAEEPQNVVAGGGESLKTNQGTFHFTRKLRVFATSYDPNCSGCNLITASGLRAGYGVIAVDPGFIPLGSKVYVPGYGQAIAGDTGGSIKGAKIDLGFNSTKTGWWSSRYTDIYILSK